jgi:hypothetical protein
MISGTSSVGGIPSGILVKCARRGFEEEWRDGWGVGRCKRRISGGVAVIKDKCTVE